MKRYILSLALLFLLVMFSLLTLSAAASGTEVAGGPHDLTWALDPPGERLSAGLGADIPRVVPFPDGERLLVVYNQWVTGQDDRDPYYTILESGSWRTPAPIYQSAGVDSGNVTGAVDGRGRAHAAWIEPGAGLYYARWNGSDWTAPQSISLPGGSLYMAPAIATRGTDTIHVVWGQNQPPQVGNPSIYHSSSANGGASWSTPTAVGGGPTAPTSLAPALAVDGAGTVHVAWQETIIVEGQTGYQILYSNNENGWLSPLSLSPGLRTVEQPNLLIEEEEIHVSFTRSDTVEGERQKWIYYVRCGGNCAQVANWSDPLNISGEALGVNEADPFWSIADMGRAEGCIYVFFYGFVGTTYTQEQIWNVNSCDGWQSGGQDAVTGTGGRGLYPNGAFVGEDVHLVYEFVSNTDHHIYHLPGSIGDPTLYLPVLMRR